MKKITILSLHLGTGGAEQAIASLSNILINQNEVEIVSVYKLHEKPAFYIDPRVKITYLTENIHPNGAEFKKAVKAKNIVSIFKEGIKSLRILYLRKKLMIQAIKNCDADIIISTRVLFSNWLGKYGKVSSIKIAQEHNHHNFNEKVIKKTVKSLNKIDYFMPVSKELTDFYDKLLKDKKTKCVYIPHCLDYFPNEDELSKLENKSIISAGRLSKEKGFLDLIDVFKLVYDFDDSLKFDIVGDGEERQAILDKIHDLGMENAVTVHGFKNKKELGELYRNSDLYVMTSFTESFGLVLVEAESYGLPILAFDSAQGAKEIIVNDENGYLIKNRSKEIMSKKILELMENLELRRQLGRAGRKLAEKYKIDNVSKEWEEFISNIG